MTQTLPVGDQDSPNIAMIDAGIGALRETGLSSQKRGENGRLADERTIVAIYRAMCRVRRASEHAVPKADAHPSPESPMTSSKQDMGVVPADDDLVELQLLDITPTGAFNLPRWKYELRAAAACLETDQPLSSDYRKHLSAMLGRHQDAIASLSSELARCRNALEEARIVLLARGYGAHTVVITDIDAALNPIGEEGAREP